MRDLLLAAFIGAGALAGLRYAWIGVLVWTWVSLMNPHNVFGYAAANWPVAQVVGICVLLGLLFARDRQNPFQMGPAPWLLLAFSIWLCITLPFSIYFDDSQPLWLRTMKTFLMIFVTLSLINTERKLKYYIWVMVASVAFFGVKGGIFTLATGGNYRVWGPGGFIGGNNEVALALVTIIPLMRYVHLQLTDRRLRAIMLGCIGLCAVTALGTYSRGALLAVGAIVLFLWLKGPNKTVWAVVWAVVGATALSFMPDHWWARMETIETYREDDSALGRINAWWMAFNLARDRLLGGGFMIYMPEIFQRYSPEPDRVHAAHSIYFQVLGEHGFIGLILFLAIGATTWMTARWLIKAGRQDAQDKWAADLGAMVQVSMIGYAVAGAFLSLTYYDLPYNIMAAAVIAKVLVQRRRAEAAKSAAPSGPSLGFPMAVPAGGEPARPVSSRNHGHPA